MIRTPKHCASLFALVFSCLILATSTNAEPQAVQPPEGFVALFNGKDFTGWRGRVGSPIQDAAMDPDELQEAQQAANQDMREHWTIVDGELHFDGNGHSLCTIADYADFELYVDWMIKPQGDSGIYLRGTPQVQIWDTTHEPLFKYGADKGSGSLWNNKKHENLPLTHADNEVGQWNTMFIRIVGDRVTVRLNDKLVVDNTVLENYWNREEPLLPTGPIELQSHGDELRFRNIFIRELEKNDEDNASDEAY